MFNVEILLQKKEEEEANNINIRYWSIIIINLFLLRAKHI